MFISLDEFHKATGEQELRWTHDFHRDTGTWSDYPHPHLADPNRVRYEVWSEIVAQAWKRHGLTPPSEQINTRRQTERA
jgi:hypothetical protein